MDDKTTGIIAVTVICCLALSLLGVDAKDIAIPVVTGIFGVITGRASK